MNRTKPRSARFCLQFLFVLIVLFLHAPVQSPASPSLTLCVHPYLSAAEIQKHFSPFVSYLSRELGFSVRLHISKDYDEQLRMTANNEVSLSFLGPVEYVRLVESSGQQRLLGRLETRGKPFFRGVIFVPARSPVRSLPDLAGKRFAFGDKRSTMSSVVPRLMLSNAGVNVDKLGRHIFGGNHENVVLGVLMGDFDAGAVMEDVFLEHESKGLRAIARTGWIPEHVFVAGRSLPPALTGRIRTILLDMKNTEGGRKALRSIRSSVTGIAPAEDGDYTELRSILGELKKTGGGRP